MTRNSPRRELFALVAAMHEALDKQRWQRIPALHRHLMRQFNRYQRQEISASELSKTKSELRREFAAIIQRREQRLSVLQEKMEKHRRSQQGMLAYSTIGLFSEKS